MLFFFSFSGITQNMPDGSCATQYKMAFESVPGNCSSEVMYINDSDNEQSYLPHIADNFFHTKFKIDPNELYTFHDSDVIAGEITVSHTEDNLIFPDNNLNDKLKETDTDSVCQNETVNGPHLTNGIVKTDNNDVLNGHLPSILKTPTPNHIETKTANTKVQKAKTHNNTISKTTEVRRQSVSGLQNQSIQPQAQSGLPANNLQTNVTITSNANPSSVNEKASGKKSNAETFLDVFKREQGLTQNTVTIKTEPNAVNPVITIKPPTSAPKKPSAGKL